MKQIAYAVMASAAMVFPAHAVEMTGGSVEFGYSAFTDETSFSRLFGAGSAEIGFTRIFSTQADIAIYRFNEIGETGYNGTLHAVFHVSNQASIGGFVGRDKLDDIGSTFYGLEAGFEVDKFRGEAYYSTGDSNDVDEDMFGLKIGFDMTDTLGLRASYDRADAGVADANKLAVGLDYAVSPTGVLYGEIGTAEVSAFGASSGSEPFVGIGAKFNFGAARGTTFGRRGLLAAWPGL